ncbi:MAG TPA: site-specific DNA-methyltransferase, partial [Gaiellaceae bacterium]|nr:site-specific DNA-methyltransferase [Gaiellaceae bacterium]
LLRPEVGTQAQFRKRKQPKSYRYDSSLSPALDWDGQNAARELGEWLLAQIEEASALDPPFAFPEPRRFGDVEVCGLHDAVARLKALSRPFLDWSGKAERLSFDVPTLPLFVHERLSTKAILETLSGHKRDRQMELQLFADPQLSLAQQLEAYEHRGGWVNRMILGDSLVVMNSLLEYEGLGGQVQMIYIDPPYGVKFGSNFQPFVRRRDVKDGDDGSLTREPEMVKAYRDTWELGLHSYLSYLRDRLLVARELLTPSGSVFVQISDDNISQVRDVAAEVFGGENFCGLISFRTTGGQSAALLSSSVDYLLWFARDKGLARARFQNPTVPKTGGREASGQYTLVEPIDGSEPPRSMTEDELSGRDEIPVGWRILAHDTLFSQGDPSDPRDRTFRFEGKDYSCPPNTHWKPGVLSGGMDALAGAGRLMLLGNTLRYKRYVEDFPAYLIDNVWNDTTRSGFSRKKQYVVETSPKVVERCVLMTTQPGDLVLDPTCGSGTTAFVVEQWGRRWITIDTSRVPLALARQRLLTATFPYYELQDTTRGPAGGFVYKRKQNAKGEEVGGIVPHVTLKSIANDEPPKEEVLVDRPEVETKITRVTGPFVVEATIPTPLDVDEADEDEAQAPPEGSYADRMLEALRRSPVIQLPGNRSIAMKNIRPPARSLSFSAEAALEPDGQPIAIVFGPENGAVGERLVNEAVREAYAKSYEQLLVVGFAIEPYAREFVDKAEQLVGIPVTYVQATPDLVMGDLLKTMRSSQIFSVTGLPDVAVREVPPAEKGEPDRYQVELRGLDVFDPSDMSVDHRTGDDVPAWFLDTDYNGMVFHVSQAFFPRTGAWDSVKKSLKGELEDSVWDHLAGTTSAPFEAGDSDEIAVKVIDDRGNELLVVKKLSEAS